MTFNLKEIIYYTNQRVEAKIEKRILKKKCVWEMGKFSNFSIVFENCERNDLQELLFLKRALK